MSEAFDPYYKWLAIPPSEQPPTHYRLLALPLFEDDTDVIRDAAEQRMAHVRTYQLGEQCDLSQKVLNELAAARACLLNPEKKAVYDTKLRSETSTPTSPLPVALPVQARPSEPAAFPSLSPPPFTNHSGASSARRRHSRFGPVAIMVPVFAVVAILAVGLSGIGKRLLNVMTNGKPASDTAVDAPKSYAGHSTPTPSVVEENIAFSSDDAGALFLFRPETKGQWSVKDGLFLLSSPPKGMFAAVYKKFFKSISSVVIEGEIVPPNRQNLRVSVGPVNMFLNWENADENHFYFGSGRPLPPPAITRPSALIPGRMYKIEVRQEDEQICVLIDGKRHFQTYGYLQGTVTIYTTSGTIAVRSMNIVGEIDATRKVTRPSHDNLY